MLAKIALPLYGLFLVIGAYFGWKAGSRISLIMGLTSGTLILICAVLAKANPTTGYGAGSAIAGILVVTFLIRLIKTHKVMPSGALMAVSILVLIILVDELMRK